jgi:sugar phosphate isomerase/epimerase
VKLGVCLQVFHDRAFDEALDAVRALGLAAVEIPVHAGAPHVDLDAANAADVIARIRRRGLEISALSNHREGQLLLGPHTADTAAIHPGTAHERIAYATQRLRGTANLARALEVGVVCAFAGCEDWSRWFPWPDPDGWERMKPVVRDRLLPLLDHFGGRGVRLALECHPRQIAYNTETALLLVEWLDGHPALAFNLDPGNLLLAGVDPVVFVRELGDRIVHVHAKDGERVLGHVERSGLLAHGNWFRSGRGFRFRVPGWGDVPWPRLITELHGWGYRGVVAIEHEDPTMSRMEGLRQAVRCLEPLMLREEPPETPWW